MYLEENSIGFFKSMFSIFNAKEESAPQIEKIEDTTFTNHIDEIVDEHSENTDSLDKPMKTRTVDYSQQSDNDDKDANEGKEEDSIDDHAQKPENTDILFATKFIEKGGKFIYAETLAEAINELRKISEENNWHYVYFWEKEIKEVFYNNDFQKGMIGYTVENSDAAISLCEVVIANNGNILLNSQQASCRRLPVFPKTQFFLVDTTRLAFDMHEAVQTFAKHNKDELPSVLDLADNQKWQYNF